MFFFCVTTFISYEIIIIVIIIFIIPLFSYYDPIIFQCYRYSILHWACKFQECEEKVKLLSEMGQDSKMDFGAQRLDLIGSRGLIMA